MNTVAESGSLYEAGSKLMERAEALRSASYLEAGDYYLLEFHADPDGKPAVSKQTHWVGWSKGKPKREIREASRVSPEKTLKLLGGIGRPPLIINNVDDFGILVLFGGYGLVERSALPGHYLEFDHPGELARDSSGLGFVGLSGLPKSKLQHAPTKKLRMDILKRDGARCLICGRSPANHVDLELHVHHVIPWGEGGLTETANLVTLCHTCHGGLDPHNDPFVRRVMPEGEPISDDYNELLLRYRRALFSGFGLDE
jgi:hypothetical protein